MRASTILIERLKKFESCRLTAYQDSKGVWTIGYGHTKGVKKGDKCTQYMAEQYLKDDLAEFEKYVSSCRGISTQGQFDAVLDFCYNCGTGNYKSSTLKRYIESGMKTAEIQKQFLRWTYSGGKELPGLYSRRIWEAARWND